MKLFMSYSTRNKEFVRKLHADLERGFEVWLDEHALQVGADLALIETGVRASDCLVVVLSQAAAESTWVDREIECAERFGVRVLPVLLEDVRVERHARSQQLSFADFRRASEYRRSVQHLIAAIEGDTDRARFLRAKEAVALVKATRNPSGELSGSRNRAWPPCTRSRMCTTGSSRTPRQASAGGGSPSSSTHRGT